MRPSTGAATPGSVGTGNDARGRCRPDAPGDITAELRAAHDDGDPDRLLGQRLYPVLDADGGLLGVVTRAQLVHADPADRTPLAELTAAPVTAHPDETLRTFANRMAQHDVTRLLVVTREEHPGWRASSASATC